MSAPTYAPPRLDTEIDLDLSRNEGRPPAADLVESVINTSELVRRYPNTNALRDRLASLHGVQSDQVLVTAGGDDALFRCVLARLGPGSTALATTPTFEMVPIYSAQVGAELVEIDWWEGPFPKGEFISAATDADVVFVVSPNNPTGATITEAELREVAKGAKLVVFDAAYTEFSDRDLTPAALNMGNVVVVRTLSKAYGLAGLRVGYLLGRSDLITEIGAYGSPYPVSALSMGIALKRLDRMDEVDWFVERVRSERGEMSETLDRLGAGALPSQANFVLAKTEDADWFTDACASLGVGVRQFPERQNLDQYVRITVPGDVRDFARLNHTLATVLAPQALLFDLDGVLVDVNDSYRRSIIETAASFGVAITDTAIDEATAAGGANDDWDLTRRLLAEQGIEVEYDLVVTRFEEIYQGQGGTPGLKKNERPLVDSDTWKGWAEKFPLGVVTGRPRPDAEDALDRFGLMTDTSVLVTREDAPLKPDPGPIRLALERLEVEHAWMVGDTPDDVEAARLAGVLPIGVVLPGADPLQTAQVLSRAARILDRTLDLKDLLP